MADGGFVPLDRDWIAAAVINGADVFSAPFWCFLYVLVVGIGAFVWGIANQPIRPLEAGFQILRENSARGNGPGRALYLLFWALVGTGH